MYKFFNSKQIQRIRLQIKYFKVIKFKLFIPINGYGVIKSKRIRSYRNQQEMDDNFTIKQTIIEKINIQIASFISIPSFLEVVNLFSIFLIYLTIQLLLPNLSLQNFFLTISPLKTFPLEFFYNYNLLVSSLKYRMDFLFCLNGGSLFASINDFDLISSFLSKFY